MINVKLPDETVEFIIGDAAIKIVFADSDQAARVPAGVRTVPFDDGEDPFEVFKIPTESPSHRSFLAALTSRNAIPPAPLAGRRACCWIMSAKSG